jgi:hypothetical protein
VSNTAYVKLLLPPSAIDDLNRSQSGPLSFTQNRRYILLSSSPHGRHNTCSLPDSHKEVALCIRRPRNYKSNLVCRGLGTLFDAYPPVVRFTFFDVWSAYSNTGLRFVMGSYLVLDHSRLTTPAVFLTQALETFGTVFSSYLSSHSSVSHSNPQNDLF